MKQSIAGVLSDQEIKAWTARLTMIWKPTDVPETRQRANGGFLFIASVAPDMHLHIGVRSEGVDLCALWCGKECVLWDSVIGFCSSWFPITAPEDQASAAAFLLKVKPLVRRNCFLLGGDVQATAEEQTEWLQWLSEQTEVANATPDSNLPLGGLKR